MLDPSAIWLKLSEFGSQPNEFMSNNVPSLNDLGSSHLIELNYLAGVVDNSKLHQLQKTVFRVSRGNILTLYVNLGDTEYSGAVEGMCKRTEPPLT